MQILNKNEIQPTYFVKMNKWLFQGKYREEFNIKPNDATVYAFYQDRFMTTTKRDLAGNDYFIYENEKLAAEINLSEKTIRNSQKKLMAAGLIHVESQGYDPKNGHRKANHIYLLNPKVSEEAICKTPVVKISEGENHNGQTRKAVSKQDLQVSYQFDLPPVKISKESDNRLNRYIDNKDTTLRLIISKFTEAQLPMIYKNKVAQKQSEQLSALISKINNHKIIDRMVEKTINHADIKDAPNFLIACLRNEVEKQNKKPTKRNFYSPKKRVEQGTDWSKKKAPTNSGIDADKLHKFFVEIEAE